MKRIISIAITIFLTIIKINAQCDPPTDPPGGDPEQSFCAIDDPTLANILVTGTGIIWYDAAAEGNVLPSTTDLVDGETYFASQTISECESITRLAVTVTLNDPAAPTGNSSQSFCTIDNPTIADLTIATTGTAMRWYNSATGGTALSTSTALVNGSTYFATQTLDGCESDTRLSVTVTLSDPPAPSATSPQSFCAIDNPVVADLTATGTAIQWYWDETGGTALSELTVLSSGATYYASQTVGGCESDTRMAVRADISDPAAPSATSPQSFCAIDNPTVADLTATGESIRWYSSSTGGTALSSSTPLVSGTYFASQTLDGCESDTRRAVTVTVSDPAAPAATSPQSFCAIDNPTIADLSATGTAIQWYASASGGSALPTSTALVNGTTYFATQTVGGCESDTRRAVTITVSDPAAPTGNSSQSFCAIDNPTIADLTRATTGTAMRWYASPTGGTALSTSTALVNGSTYYATQTIAGCESDSRLSVTVTISDPPAPTGTATQLFCATDDPLIADLIATGTAVQWYTTATGGSALSSSSALVNGTIYYASQTIAGCESDTRLSVTVTVSDPSAPTIGTITQPTCTVSTGAVVLNSLPSTGTWTLLMSPGNITTTGTGTSTNIINLEAGTYTFSVTNSDGCTSASSVNVVINEQPPTPTVPITGTITQPTCTVATGSVEFSGLPATGSWTITRTPGNLTTTGTGTNTILSGLPEGTYTFTVTNASGCTSESTAEVVINAQPPTPAVPVIGTITQPTCTVATGSVTLTGLPSSGTWILTRNPDGTALTGTGTSTTISGLVAGTYTFTVTNASGCTSEESANAVINVQPPTPTAPVIGTVTQPTYTVSTGRVILTGLPATGTWTLTRSPGNITTTGTGTSTTISGLMPGIYSFTVTNSFGCTSAPSANVTFNSLKLYGSDGTLIRPNDTLKIEQPDSGSFSINVESNAEWAVNDNSLWFKAIKKDDSTIEVTYMENISSIDKVAAFRITYPLNPQLVIHIRQKARISQLNISKFKDVKMYPNPAGDFFLLDFGKEDFDIILLSITNIQGHTILAKEYNNVPSGGIIQLNISGFPVGQYLIIIRDGFSHKTFQLIKY